MKLSWCAAALALAGCGAEPAVSTASGALAPDVCISSGGANAINAALSGPGAAAVLCQDATILLDKSIQFSAANQSIYTQGRPTGPHRAVLRLHDASVTTAIAGGDQSGLTIESVIVDGNRPNLGHLDGGALIELGGNATNQTVRHVRAHDTRSWSTLHLFEGSVTNDVPGCQNALVTESDFGPAGDDDPSLGQWADGISLACGGSVVSYNTITDATDGAIVIFGAPGSTIYNNTIVAATRQLLGGINMVDYAPVHGNYEGTFVETNTVDGQGAYIKVAYAMGPQIWSCTSGTNHGAAVLDNTITGENVGYGFAVNGVDHWGVVGNVDNARHVGHTAAQCGGSTSQPWGFQYQAATNSNLQSEFRPAGLNAVLGVTEPPILRAATAPTTCTDLWPGQGLYPNQSIASCDGRFNLVMQSDGNLVLYEGATPLWATGTVGRSSSVAILQADGNFVVYDAAGYVVWASNTAGNPNAYLAVQNDGNLVLYSSSNAVLWASNTCCH